ncbi:hypothetical protein M8C21_016657, partial [Ambrosia artemisiifolia]
MKKSKEAAKDFEFFTAKDLEDVVIFITENPELHPGVEDRSATRENPVDKGKRVVDVNEETMGVLQTSVEGGMFSGDVGGSSADATHISPVSQPVGVEDYDDSIKPNIRAKNREWEDVVTMYKAYAGKCGFSTRRWRKLLEKYGLTDNDWLTDMFNMKELWVPAYFREIPMSCLMKTTSRCESSNAAFKVNSSWANTLVQFLLCFDTTMDTQRYNQRVAEHQTETRVPELKTGLPIEKQCALVYSQTVFYEVRQEIQKGLLMCFISNQEEVDGVKVYTVTHLDKRSDVVNEYTVKVDATVGDTTCSCNLWARIGYLCRHIFCVFRYTKVDAIPEKYIMARWRRDVLPRSVFSIDARYGVDHSATAVMQNGLLEMFNQCVDRLSGSPEMLCAFSEQFQGMKDEVMGKGVGDAEHDGANEHVITNLLRVPEETEGSCSNPQGIRNKGCGTN